MDHRSGVDGSVREARDYDPDENPKFRLAKLLGVPCPSPRRRLLWNGGFLLGPFVLTIGVGLFLPDLPRTIIFMFGSVILGFRIRPFLESVSTLKADIDKELKEHEYLSVREVLAHRMGIRNETVIHQLQTSLKSLPSGVIQIKYDDRLIGATERQKTWWKLRFRSIERRWNHLFDDLSARVVMDGQIAPAVRRRYQWYEHLGNDWVLPWISHGKWRVTRFLRLISALPVALVRLVVREILNRGLMSRVLGWTIRIRERRVLRDVGREIFLLSNEDSESVECVLTLAQQIGVTIQATDLTIGQKARSILFS